ncbi:hypothetical protein BaRGS_00003653, partial [Batillaria attramentaria]
SILDGIFRAAESCELTAYINRVGRANIQRALGQLSREEAAKYEAFIQEQMQAEADGTCGRTQTGTSQTADAVQQMQAEADGTCTRRQSRQIDEARRVMTGLLQASLDCQLTSFVNRIDPQLLQRAFAAMGDDAARIRQFVSEKLREESAGRCGGDGPVRTETRPPTRPTTSRPRLDTAVSGQDATVRRVVEGVFQAASQCRLTAFVRSVDRQLLARVINSFGDRATRFEQFIGQ